MLESKHPALAIESPTVLVEYALRQLALPHAQVAIVGDQYLTDIAPANLVGIRSIKVATVTPESFSAAVRVLQRVDRTMYHLATAWNGFRVVSEVPRRSKPRQHQRTRLLRVRSTPRPSFLRFAVV
jgi:FMN phosphatase YigB (HAD superfamily)